MLGQAGVLVIGVGNRHRGDDAAGPVTADCLRENPPEAVTIEDHSGEGASLIEAFERTAAVIAIDAVCSDAAPGTIHRFDVTREKLPTGFFRYSTHAFSLAEAIETARALGRLPSRIVVYGIEGQAFELGGRMTAAVAEAARTVASRVRTELAGWRAGSGAGDGAELES
jgi:hydrogenase maturation protease